MARLEFCDKHNMVAYLVKSEGSEGFHEIIDFLSGSHIYYALTESPTIYVSLIEQFWQTAALSTTEDGDQAITATIDEIFEQLTQMGYAITSDSLTFQKGHFAPQWKFFIHTILHCMSSKKTAWDQFNSNIATAIICLATNRTFNFSKFIFDAMGKNLDSTHKFLMYPRFIQIVLNKHQRLLSPHTRTYPTPTLTNKLFNNIRRASKGYYGIVTPLFATMLVQDQQHSTSPSRITFSPSLSSQKHQPSPLPQPMDTTHETEEPAPMPHDSPLYSVHLLGRDEGSMQHTELMELVTKLTDKIKVLEKDLQQTKKTYGTAFTKLMFRVKKLEKQVKSGKARKRDRIDEGTLWFQEDEEVHEKTSADTEVLLEEETPTELVEDVGSGGKGEKEVNTANVPVSTAGAKVSTASTDVSTAAAALVYIRRSAEKKKDKGKAIMIKSEPPKKIKKRDQEQQEKSDFETALLEIQRQFDKRQEVSAKPTQTQSIDWNDPSVLRYHALKNKPVFVTQARKNMITFLKNQGCYKLSDFKKMSYDDIRPIFKKVWDQVQSFVPMDTKVKEKAEQVELESSKKVGGSRRKTLDRKRAGEKKSADSVKRQKLQEAEVYEKEKEELRLSLKLIPIDDSEVNYEPLSRKFPIMDWEYQLLGRMEAKDMAVYKVTRADGSASYHGDIQAFLRRLDRQDLEAVYRLAQEKFQDHPLEGHDLMLWGDLRMLFDPNTEDEVWMNQQDWKLMKWKLHESCGIHTLSMWSTPIEINMLVEKKYPLTKDILKKMLRLQLEAEEESTMALELVKFIKSLLEEE
ncbi:hypothetical protein Tco_0779873 [Tanacetum coccineum]